MKTDPDVRRSDAHGELVKAERESLRRQLADWLEPVLVLLGLVTLALLLVRPDERFQPRTLVVVAHIDRVEVEPCAPDDLRQMLRQRSGAVDMTGEARRRRHTCRCQLVAVEVVGIPVGQQAQSGRSPDFQ